MIRIVRAVVMAVAVALTATPAGAQSSGRVVFVRVANASGPLLSLTPEDFSLRENGEIREITSARPASDPMRIALIVDTSEAAAPAQVALREGLQEFIRTLPGVHEVVFITTGGQLRVQAPPTTDREPLARAVSTMFADNGRSNVLLDSLVETHERFLRSDEVTWPVFVVITTDGPEGSRVTRTEEFNAFVQSLAARAATVHAILLQSGGGGSIPSQVATGLTDLTGGVYESLNTNAAGGLPETLRRLAQDIAAHHERMSTYYRVEFRSGSSTPQPVEIGVTTDERADMDILFARRLRQ